MIHAAMSFDGGVRGGNPGHAGFAAVIRLAGKLHTIARPLKGLRTNNYAEYMGLIVGAKYAHTLGATMIDITSDSKLVVNQVNDNWRCDSHDMLQLCTEAQAILDRYFTASWKLEWVPRERNMIADAACAQAVRCALNPWIPNRLDPFAKPFAKQRGNPSRTHTRTPTRARRG
jgi:ribonuclease HI